MCWYGSPIGYQPPDGNFTVYKLVIFLATMHVRQIQGKVPGHKDAKGFHEMFVHYFLKSFI